MLGEVSAQNSWLTVIASFIPGLLLIYVYSALLGKSSQPFPLMLEEHLGIAGKVMGIAYIIVFLILASFYLRFFTEFLEITVLFNTPTSLIILALLIPGTYAIRSGMEVIARISEVIFIVFLPLSLLLLLTSVAAHPDLDNLLPLAFISLQDLGYGIYLNTWHLANMIIVLALAYFTCQRDKLPRTLLVFLVTLTLYLSVAMAVSVITLGVAIVSSSTFPLFEIARSASYAGFIRNTEPVFVSIFNLGIFISVVVFWLMACYSTQQLFRLQDYRFLATPSAIIIGFHAILLSPNTYTIFRILRYSAPLIFGVFFVLIPVLLYILLLFRPRKVNEQTGSGLQSPET